jgi:hypothetical protein
MRGRGARTILPTDLQRATSSAERKDRFILVDTVGVPESVKTPTEPLERDRTLSLEALLERSGNSTIEAPASAARRAWAMVSAALKAGSATRSRGAQAAARTKPWVWRLWKGVTGQSPAPAGRGASSGRGLEATPPGQAALPARAPRW